MTKEIKFETIKSKAKALLHSEFNIDNWTGYAGWSNDAAFKMLAHFAIVGGEYMFDERPALQAFAAQFVVNQPRGQKDQLALYAKAMASRKFRTGDSAQELALVALRAREEALRLIDKWDVRRVSTLIDLFPSTVPASFHKHALVCFMADDEDSSWMVALDGSKPRDPIAPPPNVVPISAEYVPGIGWMTASPLGRHGNFETPREALDAGIKRFTAH